MGFGVGCSGSGGQCPLLIPLRSHTLSRVPVAQAPAQSSVWGCFIWGQTSLISQLGPASDQRAAFISQGSGHPPDTRGTAATTVLPKYPKISPRRVKPRHGGSASWALAQPQPVSGDTSGRATQGAEPPGMCVVAVEPPCSLPDPHPATGSTPPRQQKCVFCLQQGKFSFVFPCGGGCPPACAPCADSLTH